MTLLDPPLNRSYLVLCIWQQNYILTESCFPSFKFFSYLNEIISSVVDIFLLPRHPPQSINDVPLEVVQVLLVGGVVAAVLHVAEVSLGQPRHQQDITVQERSHLQIETKVGLGLVEATILSFLHFIYEFNLRYFLRFFRTPHLQTFWTIRIFSSLAFKIFSDGTS